jgi:hypothetical protein
MALLTFYQHRPRFLKDRFGKQQYANAHQAYVYVGEKFIAIHPAVNDSSEESGQQNSRETP